VTLRSQLTVGVAGQIIGFVDIRECVRAVVVADVLTLTAGCVLDVEGRRVAAKGN
jgi:hypothetical protein